MSQVCYKITNLKIISLVYKHNNYLYFLVRVSPHTSSTCWLGRANSYDIYQEKGVDNTRTVLVHINDSEEIQTDFKEAGWPKNEIPASIHGTPVESMYPTLSTM